LIPQDFFVENLCEKLEMLLSTAYNKNMNTNDKKTFFILNSGTSAASTIGLRPRVLWAFGKDIIGDAKRELDNTGGSFEEMAGIGWVEDEEGDFLEYERALTDDEILKYSVEKMSDDRREYSIFPTTEEGAAEFIAYVKHFDMEEEARAVVEDFNE
jgi:hypothetical protein